MKRSPKPYLFLLAIVLLLMSMPKSITESIRGFAIATFVPVWSTLADTKDVIQSHGQSNQESVLQKLQLDNRYLNAEVARLQELLKQECSINAQLKALTYSAGKIPNSKAPTQYDLLSQRLSTQTHAVPAQVIYRSPSTWNSSLWLDVGLADNAQNGTDVIARNSPVIVGTSIVGVIDYVGQHQSRVRLITDSGLSPSVRAVRGDLSKRLVAEQIALLTNRLSCSHGLFKNQDEKESMIKQLSALQKRLFQGESQEIAFLAKGELHGGGEPLWRTPGSILKGIGFNYDFPDKEGPARDLRTGKPLNGTEADKTMPILLVTDLLVTTGMDGVFPAGFYVAEVTKIDTLKEGDYFYELEAKPTAGDLQELTTVFVLPPVRREEFSN